MLAGGLSMTVTKSKSGRSTKQGSKRGASLTIGLATSGPAPRFTPTSGKISLAPDLMKGIVARKGAAKGVLSGFGRAVLQAERSGKPVRMTVVVEPEAISPRIAVEEMSAPAGNALDTALAAARTRGAARAADILNGEDMLTADAFAEEIGATRETVHKKRRRHEVLGLEGPKRGIRFPKWQVSRSGELLPGLPLLFRSLGDHPWAVYRFLLQEHAELGGGTALEALRRGRVEDVIAVAGSIGAGAFA
ncbi:hypothetical protein K9U39_17595 [Rhodoblastus acidophilus]|uniref:hypothetical protein n=1 Tax=Candidatus Rhodoblastus alkanivorans TaxID=2954117 RepID=UPI001FAAEB8B|nr:hypothetical protein [Candidatus Rhodoblastus alkanivorans]MCI4679064.1 hypothetical protein [Candidatus Rhodoblastus alkanivorans]MDI4642729.1 hypothetical protein [Rhodoblastus acidophilus]